MIREGKSLAGLFDEAPTAEQLETEHKLDISIAVYRRMEELGMNQNDLAERMGVDRSQVSRILKGKMNITLRTIARLEEALGFRLDAGFQGEEKSKAAITIDLGSRPIASPRRQRRKNAITVKPPKAPTSSGVNIVYLLDREAVAL
ncbi:MAG: helix-turn-helix transcriptional regulator [Olegusella sp.]|nr:helix-turn-helix transcriptional regulator [Olegusella sp.]